MVNARLRFGSLRKFCALIIAIFACSIALRGLSNIIAHDHLNDPIVVYDYVNSGDDDMLRAIESCVTFNF